MSSKSHGVLTKRTSCAIHAFLFLWPEILSLFPFQIVLWTFYQYEVIVTQYIRLVIQASQSSVCKAEAPKNSFPQMGDPKIESPCVSWWSLLLEALIPLVISLLWELREQNPNQTFRCHLLYSFIHGKLYIVFFNETCYKWWTFHLFDLSEEVLWLKKISPRKDFLNYSTELDSRTEASHSLRRKGKVGAL